MSNSFKGAFFVSLAALIWGLTGVAQSLGNSYMGVFTFNASRAVIGSVCLMPAAWLSIRTSGKKPRLKTLLTGGILSGASLWICHATQQYCLKYLPVGKVIFLLALYVLAVPILNWHRDGNPGKKYWSALALVLLGLYMLCLKGGKLDFSFAEVLMLLAAFTAALHIIITDRFVKHVDCCALISVEFALSAILSIPIAVFFEEPQLVQLAAGWKPLLYVGIIGTAVGYSFEAIGQKHCPPSIASILLSLETVYAVVGGWIILGQAMTANEILGCALMLTGTIIAQIPIRRS